MSGYVKEYLGEKWCGENNNNMGAEGGGGGWQNQEAGAGEYSGLTLILSSN